MESELAEIKALLAKVLSNQEALLKSPENALNGLKPELEKKVTKRKTKWQTYDEQTKIDKTIARMAKARSLLDEHMRKLFPEDNKELKQKIEKALRSEKINREQFDNFNNIRLLGNTAVHEPKKMNPGDKKVQHQVNVYYNYIWAFLQQSEVFRKDAFLNPKKKEQNDQEQEEKKEQKKPKEPKEKKEQIGEKVPKDQKKPNKPKEQKEQDIEEKKEPKEQKKPKEPKEKKEQDGQKQPKEHKEKKEPGEQKEKKEKKEKEKKEQDGQKEQKPKKQKEQKE